MFLTNLQISVENTCVGDRQACNFIKKKLQHKCFPVKFLGKPFSTEQLRWLLFKIRNCNKSVQRCFSDLSYVQPISDNLQFSQSQTNLKMHSLITNLFRQSVFVADLEQTPFFPKSDPNIKGATKFYFVYYSRFVIILFSMGLYNSAFSTYSFGKTRFSSFCVLALCVSVSGFQFSVLLHVLN